MKYWNKKLAREQLDSRLKSLKLFLSFGTPQQGWIKTIREALGLSANQLGKRAGFDQSRISRLEKAEINGNLKVSSLQKIAKGFNMKFVYGFVSEGSLDDMVREQAKKIALKRMKILNTTMGLEKQGLSPEDQKKSLDNMIEKILLEQPKDFWN